MPAVSNQKNARAETKEKANKQTKIETTPPQQQQPTTYFHRPFLENQCDSCHETKFSQRLVVRGKELCFSCHGDFTKDKKIVHYPVSEGACIECHDPHQSPNKFLLKKAIPEICFSCHDEKDIKANPTHKGQNMCTDCHNAHASNEEKLLK